MIRPVVAPLGTTAVICEPKKLKSADKPLNLTDVTPLRFSPLMMTLVPAGPVVGEKLIILGRDKVIARSA